MRMFLAALAALSIFSATAAYGNVPPASGFGTGVFFDEGSRLGPGDFSAIRDGAPSTEGRDGKSAAIAKASLEAFQVGVLLEDQTGGRMGGAQAASSYAIEGAPEGGIVPGLYFSIQGKTAATGPGGFSAYFAAYDYKGNFLADVSFVGERLEDHNGGIVEKDTFVAHYCPDPVAYPGDCSDPVDRAKTKAVFLSGEGTSVEVPVLLPKLPGNGIIAELWGFTDSPVKIDFLCSALKGLPEKGTIVRLSTGQTFGGPSGQNLMAKACGTDH